MVELPDGSRYESTPQTLTASPSISATYANYEKGRSINELGNEQNDHRWNVFIETAVARSYEMYLTWRYRGVYEFETFPEDYCKQPENDCDPGPAHPRQVPPGCYKYCYVTEYGNEFTTAASGREGLFESILEKKIASIPITYSKLYNYYKLNIYQLSVSRQVYEYLQLLNQQITSQGTIFDVTPSPVNGNIHSIEDSDDTALGMFYAAGVTSAQLNLNRSGVSASFTPSYRPEDCRLARNSSDERPEDYISGNTNSCYLWWTDTWQSCDQCYDFVRQTWSKCPE